MEHRTGVRRTPALYSGYLGFKPLAKVMLDGHVFRSSSQGLETSAEQYLKL
jgi:hypothetical protein